MDSSSLMGTVVFLEEVINALMLCGIKYLRLYNSILFYTNLLNNVLHFGLLVIYRNKNVIQVYVPYDIERHFIHNIDAVFFRRLSIIITQISN